MDSRATGHGSLRGFVDLAHEPSYPFSATLLFRWEGGAGGRVSSRGVLPPAGVKFSVEEKRAGEGEARALTLMSPDINWPFWPFPRHSSGGLLSGVRLCWPGFGAGFVRIPMETPPNRLVPRQKTAAIQTLPPKTRYDPWGRRTRGRADGFQVQAEMQVDSFKFTFALAGTLVSVAERS